MSIEAMKQALEALELLIKPDPQIEAFDYADNAIAALRQAIAVYESAPPEAQTEAEKTAYAFGWFKALEAQRAEEQETVPMEVVLEMRDYIRELEAKASPHPPKREPLCPDCGAIALYECVACSSNNYPEGFVQSRREPLTDEEIKPLIQKAMMYYGHNPDHWTVTAGAGFCILARAIEAAHGIKGEA